MKGKIVNSEKAKYWLNFIEECDEKNKKINLEN